jgi:hypothetical protein
LSGDLRKLVWVGDRDSATKSWVILGARVKLRVKFERVLYLTLNSTRIDQSRGLECTNDCLVHDLILSQGAIQLKLGFLLSSK